MALAATMTPAAAYADISVDAPLVSVDVGTSLVDANLSLSNPLGGGVFSSLWGDVSPEHERNAIGPDGRWDPARDVGSLYSLTRRKGIQDAWARGITGAGVTVAVIDTGVAPVAGLTGAGKVLNGPDLSFDSQSSGTRYVDGFGHGTHMAGIIAGRDRGWDPASPNPQVFAGVAPDAQVLNMKVGAGDGGVDVTQVIAAINWVVEHRNAGGMNVRVISLAYGTSSTQSWEVDPLARAVEDAKRAGIVVVTAAGNDGLDQRSLVMPAVDPHVIAVGATDMNATHGTLDDSVASFTNGGSNERRPDFLAPGRSIASLRVPGSYADVLAPGGRIKGDRSGRFFRGSGTSQATAFVAGEAALLLQARPDLTPDEVKALLVSTARPLVDLHPAMGAGESDVVRALRWPTPHVTTRLPSSSGTGSLDASRGGDHVTDPVAGVELRGQRDALGRPWDGASWASKSRAGTTWDRGRWNGSRWTGTRFQGSSWLAVDWSGSSWADVPWSQYRTDATWDSGTWSGQTWSARSWRSDSWEARSWRSLY